MGVVVILTGPVVITSRLLPGIRVGGGEVSVEWSTRPGTDGRARCRYWIDPPKGRGYTADDLESDRGGGDLQGMLESLLGFLRAWTEALDYQDETGMESENADLFPVGGYPSVVAWVMANADELGMIECELSEHPGEFIRREKCVR